MHGITENEVVAVQQMERHDNLAVGAELHSTVEPAMKLVERQRSAFHNPLTVAKRTKIRSASSPQERIGEVKVRPHCCNTLPEDHFHSADAGWVHRGAE